MVFIEQKAAKSVDNLLDLRIMYGISYFISPRIGLAAGLNGAFEFPDHRDNGSFNYSPTRGCSFSRAGDRRCRSIESIEIRTSPQAE
jgi:hypothetical protein